MYTKIREVIEEFIPCEVCGNSDVNHFYFHVFFHWGSEPFVKCCECEEEYYSSRAKEIITKLQEVRKAKTLSGYHQLPGNNANCKKMRI